MTLIHLLRVGPQWTVRLMGAGSHMTVTKTCVQKHKTFYPPLTSLSLLRTAAPSNVMWKTMWARITLQLLMLCVSMILLILILCRVRGVLNPVTTDQSSSSSHVWDFTLSIHKPGVIVLICIFMLLIMLIGWVYHATRICFISCYICGYVVMKIPFGFLWKKNRRKEHKRVFTSLFEV